MEDKIKFIIANCCQIDLAEVGNDAKVNDTPNWDSLSHMQIMVCIEQEFGVSLDTRDIAALTSYQDILSYLKDAR